MPALLRHALSHRDADWDRRIARARELAGSDASTAALLTFYVTVLSAQKTLYQSLAAGDWRLSGVLERDLPRVRPHVVPLIRAVAADAPAPLVIRADELLGASASMLDETLMIWWRSPSDREFFPKAALQPYAQWLADAGIPLADRGLARADNRCPTCGGAPQVSVLTASREAEDGGRVLLCAACLTSWPFRRVVCVACGEEDDQKLGYFHTSELDHLRVDVCESCRSYVKTVDLAKLGIAVPLVDEIAGAPLDAWARDRGYAKVELNLLGF
jgi:formate dehydrogenase accessory protein FdhE